MILVTGASGFIGREFVKNFSSSIRPVYRHLNVTRDINCFFVKNIDDNTNWDGAFENVSSIIHLAGLAHSSSFSVEDYRRVNIEGTLHLAQKAADAGVKRFVFVSSICINGVTSGSLPFSSSSNANPCNTYAKSKLDAERGLIDISKKTGIEIVIVRPTLVYGENAPGNFGLLNKLVSKWSFLPFGCAKNRRDFISVYNLSDLLLCCATHPAAAGHIFLASEFHSVSIKELTNEIARGIGKHVIQIPVPISLMRLFGKVCGKSRLIEQLFGNLQVNSNNLKEVLGWTPPYTMVQSMAKLKNMDK